MKSMIGSFICALMVLVPTGLSAQVALPSAGDPASPAAPPGPATPTSPPPAESSGVTVIERVLVRVNGEILTQSQLTTRQIEALRSLKENAGGATDIEAELARLTPDILVTAVDELLLVQHGRELDLVFTDEQFEAAVDNIKEQNKLDDEQLRAAMAQEGLTMEELRQNFERSYFIQGVQQREIGPSMAITLEEQRQYYKRNADQFMTPLTVTLRELFITVPTQTQAGREVFSVADDNAAKARIDEFRTRALAGDDFAEMVTANSDSATRANGGLVGPVNVADMSDTLKDIVTILEVGGVSEPVRTQRGYQLFKLESRSEPHLRPFDEVRREIENAIRSERIEPETQKLLARLRSQAVIEWKDETLRQLYEQRVAETVNQ